MKKLKSFFLIWLTAGFLVLANLVASNQMANTGGRVKELEKEINVLERENASLEQKTASVSSLLKLKEQAEKLGFSSASEILYLRGEIPVAMR